MWNTIISILGIVVLFCIVVALAVVILKGADWLRFGRRTSDPMFDRTKFEQMIRNPDWQMVADVLGEVPPRLRALYETEMVLQSYFDVITGKPDEDGIYQIAEFEALRPEWREHMWPELKSGCLVLAGDGFGNEFFLRERTGPDWPVYFYDHEGGGITQLSNSLDRFLAMLRHTPDE